MSRISPISKQTILEINGGSVHEQRDAAEIVKTARDHFNTGKTKRLSFRKEQLKNLLRFLEENEDKICDAIHKDLHKPKLETMLLEVDFMKNEIKNCLMNLDKWARRETREKSLANFFDQLYVYHEPFGAVLVMGAWNYPLQLTLIPVVGAIAAGNCVIIKPSDISIATSQLIYDLLPNYIDKNCYPVFLGGIPETSALLEQRFDYIFFTGAPSIGKIIHKAAAQHLTPATLELGGKSPVYIDESADIAKTVKRILWGKCVNAGQTCIAPDYILCTKEVQEEFVKHAVKVLKNFYKGDLKNSADFCRIVNVRHFQRLIRLLPGLKIAIGGQYDEKENLIEPTIAVDVSPNDLVMQEEIFGPILPILPIQNVDEAIGFINNGEKPLSLYIFTRKSSIRDLILSKTSSGGVCVNDTLMHASPESLPFGGVGNSGMGAYHGKTTFDIFTHHRSVLMKDFSDIPEQAAASRYPPYTKNKLKIMTIALQKRRSVSLKYLPHVIMFLLGVGVAFLIMEYLM